MPEIDRRKALQLAAAALAIPAGTPVAGAAPGPLAPALCSAVTEAENFAAIAACMDAWIDEHLQDLAEYDPNIMKAVCDAHGGPEAYVLAHTVRQFMDGFFGRTPHYGIWYDIEHQILVGSRDKRQHRVDMLARRAQLELFLE